MIDKIEGIFFNLTDNTVLTSALRLSHAFNQCWNIEMRANVVDDPGMKLIRECFISEMFDTLLLVEGFLKFDPVYKACQLSLSQFLLDDLLLEFAQATRVTSLPHLKVKRIFHAVIVVSLNSCIPAISLTLIM